MGMAARGSLDTPTSSQAYPPCFQDHLVLTTSQILLRNSVLLYGVW